MQQMSSQMSSQPVTHLQRVNSFEMSSNAAVASESQAPHEKRLGMQECSRCHVLTGFYICRDVEPVDLKLAHTDTG